MFEEKKEWKIPHMIKIPEAYTAIIDARYRREGENKLIVFSSDYSKKYTVTIFENGYSSNDNMSYNKGILGYPIIVALMLENRIKIDREIVQLFKAINWTKINIKYDKDFTVSMEAVIRSVANEKYTYDIIYKNIQDTYKELKKLLGTIKQYDSLISFKEAVNL